jgi:hypothetical protein
LNAYLQPGRRSSRDASRDRSRHVGGESRSDRTDGASLACARWASDADLIPLAKAELLSLEEARAQPQVKQDVKVSTPAKPLNALVSLGQSTAADQGRRVALVIGNSNYRNVLALVNTAHDAEMVAEVFKRTGFGDVTLLEDLNKDAMIAALRNFVAKADYADWAVVYYAAGTFGRRCAASNLNA